MAVGSPKHDSRAPAGPAVEVRLPITLGQFIKVAGLVSTGGEAKMLVADGGVVVNGEVDTRRGRKMAHGDVVEAAGRTAVVAAREATSKVGP